VLDTVNSLIQSFVTLIICHREGDIRVSPYWIQKSGDVQLLFFFNYTIKETPRDINLEVYRDYQILLAKTTAQFQITSFELNKFQNVILFDFSPMFVY